MTSISIKHARVHNLKDVSLDIPKHKLIVMTGLSGSGKSSLAFDTIYAEGQRRYAESLNAYARQFMDLEDKPDVEDIAGLSPTIAIDQKNTSTNPRSTVGTATEIYDVLRLLFARLGVQRDPETGEAILSHTEGSIIESIRAMGRQKKELRLLSPMFVRAKVSAKDLLSRFEATGIREVRVNGQFCALKDLKQVIQGDALYDIDVQVGILTHVAKQGAMLASMVGRALELGNGFLIVLDSDGEEKTFGTRPFSEKTGKTYDPIEPRSFSFNSPYGACARCTGLGYVLEVDPDLVIPNPRLTLAEGAIQPWTRIVGNQQQYIKILHHVAVAHGFSVDVPVESLSQKVLDIVLYGTDGQVYMVDGKEVHYDGVLPNLTQRYTETDSEYIRKEIETYMRMHVCSVCEGKRLKRDSLAVTIGESSIADIVALSIEDAAALFTSALDAKKPTHPFAIALKAGDVRIVEPLLRDMVRRLNNLLKTGLYYLTLDRSINTLSGGEAQRIRLSSQLSTGLTDVIYILDEPSIGLHSADTDKLIETLKTLRDAGNTVIVVEHDAAMIEAADFVVDMGPGAGERGGEVVAKGTPAQVRKSAKSLTGLYLSGKEYVPQPSKRNAGNGKSIDIVGAKAHNLRNIDVSIPLGMFVSVTGVSGSGKSSLITGILSRALHKKLYRAKEEPLLHKEIKGIQHIDKVITIDQKPIGQTPRSNPATYTGVFTAIRDVYTELTESKIRGFTAGMFSFNVKGGGRCEACAGDGYITIPMQFMSDVFVECTECHGRRYNKEALEIAYRGKHIADVLNMTVEEAYHFFSDVSAIADKLQILRDVGLGYLKLGQPANNLSGGEAQRIKLATELSRRATGKTLYILDEPTTGLHFDDIRRLLSVLHKLVEKGNTVLTIEHNIDVIASADWVIDLGPEGGRRGGEVVFAGTPKDMVKNKKSLTAPYVRTALKK